MKIKEMVEKLAVKIKISICKNDEEIAGFYSDNYTILNQDILNKKVDYWYVENGHKLIINYKED